MFIPAVPHAVVVTVFENEYNDKLKSYRKSFKLHFRVNNLMKYINPSLLSSATSKF